MTGSPIPPDAHAGPRPVMLTAAYYASFVMLGLAMAVEGPSLPTLAAHTGSSLDRISLIFVASALGYLLGSLLAGRLYDRLPGHRVMSVSLVLMTVAAVFFPLASTLPVLLIAASVLGLGEGGLDVGANTLLQWLHGDRSGAALNGLHFAFGLGSFISPILLARILSQTHDIYGAFWIIASSFVPFAVWLWLLPEQASHRRAVGPGKSAVPLGPVLLIVLVFFLYVGGEVGFSNWLYTYAVTLRLADTIGAAYLTSAFWALFTVGRLLGVWLATRVRARTILVFDFAGCLVSLAFIGFATQSAAILWVGSLALGLSMASIFPTVLVLAGEKLPVSGAVTSWFLLGAGAGGMFLPWFIGIPFTGLGPQSMIALVFIDMLLDLCALLLFMSGRQTVREVASSAASSDERPPSQTLAARE